MKHWIVTTPLVIVLGAAILLFFLQRSQEPYPDRSIATQGITQSEIIIGSVAALSGPTGFLGSEYLYGARTYINAINDRGGVYGRKIELVAYDDQYDPPKTTFFTQKAIIGDRVFALLNFVGTPTGKRALPLINESQIPLVGIFSGAQLFRNPTQPNVFNIRASYYEEASAIVDELVGQKDFKKIGVLYQYDDFGFDGLKGVEIALAKHGLRTSVTASYERNTSNVTKALETIKAAEPEAVIIIGVYEPAAAFISQAKESKFEPVFATMSFVGIEEFTRNLGEYADGVIVSQTIPFPPQTPLAECPDDYTTLLHRYFPAVKPTFGGLEGFINTKVLVEGLRRAGPTPTRTSLIQGLESLSDYSIGDNITMTLGKTDHQGLDQTYLIRITNGTYTTINAEATQAPACIQLD